MALGDNQFILNSKGQQDGEFHQSEVLSSPPG